MPVSYGRVRTNCPCCDYPSVAFDSEEGRQRRRRLTRHYGLLSKVQIPLSFLATISGAVTIGLAIPNPNWPYLSCFPFINGIMLLIAGWFARRVGQANLDQEIARSVKSHVIVHYVLCVTACTFCGLAAGFGVNGLVFCLSHVEKLEIKCTPNHDAKTAFVAIDIVLATLLLPACIVGLVLFCLHARTLGFDKYNNQLSRMENEVAQLRQQVTSLQQAQGAGVPPPAYSEQGHGNQGYSAGSQAGYRDGYGYGVSGGVGFQYNEYGSGKA